VKFSVFSFFGLLQASWRLQEWRMVSKAENSPQDGLGRAQVPGARHNAQYYPSVFNAPYPARAGCFMYSTMGKPSGRRGIPHYRAGVTSRKTLAPA
jgi:hypothetical protein